MPKIKVRGARRKFLFKSVSMRAWGIQIPRWTLEESQQENYILSLVMVELIRTSQVQKQTRTKEGRQKQELRRQRKEDFQGSAASVG